MKAHLAHIKAATVRILVNGQASGSGFLVSSNGTVITCYHVIKQVTAVPNQPNPNMVQFGVQPNIQVELSTGEILAATISAKCHGAGFMPAVERDYFLLEIGGQNRPFLKLGTFNNVDEGDTVMACGFPLGIAQPVVATGILSTKWTGPNNANNGSDRAVAWLDITMNRGNSGGPVLLLKDNVQDDVVIGIATFILNPFAGTAEELAALASQPGANMNMGGLDIREITKFTAVSLAHTSHGVSGCVSIDYGKAAAGL